MYAKPWRLRSKNGIFSSLNYKEETADSGSTVSGKQKKHRQEGWKMGNKPGKRPPKGAGEGIIQTGQ